MNQDTIAKAQQALDQGRTQAEAAEAAGVGLRTVSRLIQQKKLRPRPSASVKNAPRAEFRRMWTARELLSIYEPERVPSILVSLETQAQRGNWRVHEWIGCMREARLVAVEWRFAVAFLPILARDIEAPALAALADLMRESVPWKSKELRRHYHRMAAPIMYEALGQIGEWSLHSGLVVGLSEGLGSSTGPQGEADEAAVIEALARGGRPVFGIASTDSAYERVAKGLGGTPYGVLLRLMPRLPDVDRPRRRSLWRRKDSIGELAAIWCLTVTDEWLQRVRDANKRMWSEEPAGGE